MTPDRDELLELIAARPFRGLVWGAGWYVVTRDDDGTDNVLDGPYETEQDAREGAQALADRREGLEPFPRYLHGAGSRFR